MVTLKDLAREFQVSTRTVKKWWVLVNVTPTIPGHACHRWSEADAEKLTKRLRKKLQKIKIKYAKSNDTIPQQNNQNN